MTNETPAQRLGRLIRERRKALKMTQAAIQEAGGPSTATIRLIESGKHTEFRPSTSDPLERLLRWEPGSIDAILDGGEPSLLKRPLPPLSEVPLFRGADSLRWHLEITSKPESERTPEERAWLAAANAERDRLGELTRNPPPMPASGIERYSDDELLSEVRKRMRVAAPPAPAPAPAAVPASASVTELPRRGQDDDENALGDAIAARTEVQKVGKQLRDAQDAAAEAGDPLPLGPGVEDENQDGG